MRDTRVSRLPGVPNRRSDEVIVRDIDGEILILDRVADRVHQLNVTASFIWRLHAEGLQPAAIAEAFAAEFGTDVDTATQDTRNTLTQLRDLHLV